jgi:hypothetical protein
MVLAHLFMLFLNVDANVKHELQPICNKKKSHAGQPERTQILVSWLHNFAEKKLNNTIQPVVGLF